MITDTVDLSLPFELRPLRYDGKKAILLVHGLFDSAFSMRDIGEIFYQQGFLVRAILLPGHGTTAAELFHIPCQDWIIATQLAIENLKNEAQQLYYAGFSLGASLGTYHALTGAPLAGLVLLAPAYQLNYKIMSAKYFCDMRYKLTKTHQWFGDPSIRDSARYRYFPVKPGLEALILIGKIKALASQRKITVPLFMVLTAEDEIVAPQAARRFFSLQSNPRNRLLYYAKHAVRFSDKRITVLTSCYPDESVRGFSHICLPISPDNFHYGKDRPCSEKTKLLMAEPYFYRGSLTVRSMMTRHFCHLSYNPNFKNMMAAIVTFLL